MTSKTQTDWVKIKPAEVEKMVVELAKAGNDPERIGLILRDQHGIPTVKVLGKKMKKILKENNIELDSEKKHIEIKSENLKKHIEKNKLDHNARRSLVKQLSRLRSFN